MFTGALSKSGNSLTSIGDNVITGRLFNSGIKPDDILTRFVVSTKLLHSSQVNN